MLVRSVTAALFGTNCWVLAPGEDGDCVVVDPGLGVVEDLHRLLLEHRLRPAGVLLTHGHLDHTWSVVPLTRSSDEVTAVHIHEADRYRLDDPVTALGPQLRLMLQQHMPDFRWEPPERVVALPDGGTVAAGEAALEIAGLTLMIRHTPGHTEGSVCFRVAGDGAPDTVLTGDLVFAGAVGRTDLPGGDPQAMVRSLADAVSSWDDDTVLLPGHGPTSTAGAERARNRWIREALAMAGAPSVREGGRP